MEERTTGGKGWFCHASCKKAGLTRHSQGVEDDNLNMICFGGLVVGHALAWELTQTFLAARFNGAERFRRRLDKVAQLPFGIRDSDRHEYS